MVARNDLTGRVFGRLTVKEYAYTNLKGRSVWKCKCECGQIKEITGTNLISGNSNSCGCLDLEDRANRHITHGKSRTGTYRAWRHMLSRCYNPNVPTYHRWGGRGIRVCERWHKFENFLADMGEKPKNKSIDRINNDGHYEPSNCRWATRKQQGKNKESRKGLKRNERVPIKYVEPLNDRRIKE